MHKGDVQNYPGLPNKLETGLNSYLYSGIVNGLGVAGLLCLGIGVFVYIFYKRL